MLIMEYNECFEEDDDGYKPQVIDQSQWECYTEEDNDKER